MTNATERHEDAGKPSRRDLLKTSASAAFLTELAGAMHVHAAGSDTIRVGVIGCGGRGEAASMNAMNADKGIRLVAMADIVLDRVKEVRTGLKLKYPQQMAVDDDHCFQGFDAYRKVIESVDVVIIANAAKFHPMHLKAAVEAGKHVFVEKPHAIDPYGIQTVRAACDLARQKGLSVVSGLQSRYHPAYQETMQRVHDGAVGDIVAIQETWLRPPYILRDRRPGQPEIEHQASNQYHFHWLCGDDVPQTLIHNLDRSSWAMRNQAPVRAWGMAGRSTLRAEKYGDVFDHHAVVYEFANGVRIYAYCRTIDDCYNENSSLILGAKGRCDLLKLTIQGETNWKHPGVGKGNPAYDLEHVALYKAIRSGTPLNNGEYMVRSTLITLMGQFSCYTGKQVTWDQISNSSYCHLPRPEDVRAGLEPPVKPGPDGIYPLPFTPGVSNLL
jgi:myo-inositol 2-dehydrogenase / D-chiro-inositol 1-dehydrogenase